MGSHETGHGPATPVACDTLRAPDIRKANPVVSHDLQKALHLSLHVSSAIRHAVAVELSDKSMSIILHLSTGATIPIK